MKYDEFIALKPPTKEFYPIKARFDLVVGEAYWKYAYVPEYVLLRRLFIHLHSRSSEASEKLRLCRETWMLWNKLQKWPLKCIAGQQRMIWRWSMRDDIAWGAQGYIQKELEYVAQVSFIACSPTQHACEIHPRR